jgi:hypothetical protein
VFKKSLAMAMAMATVSFCACISSAIAGGQATVACSVPGDSFGPNAVPVLQVSYSTGADAGIPGLFWFGVISQDQTIGSVLTPQGWQNYYGGLYPFQARYDGGFTSNITLSIPFPDGVQTTAAFVGYNVYAGHGIYSTDSREKVVARRASLNSVKPDMVAKGRWRPEFDSDDNFIWSLIQRDMVDNKKYGPILSIPYVDCTPLLGGGG